ncbi:phosphopantetheine-binding protein [Streptomyces albiaxialis]|uniref:Phosphopantetheine-binding protein n=1 Tax=Streptomyces albiaxialis TaxID=329523 RepID=A0ABP5HTB3_9ACTN
MDVATHVGEVLSSNFGIDTRSVPEDTPLLQLRLDSLALEELRVLLEERYGVDLEDIELSSRNTYGQLLAAVRRRTT